MKNKHDQNVKICYVILKYIGKMWKLSSVYIDIDKISYLQNFTSMK